MKNLLKVSALCLGLSATLAQGQTPRPPQFVLLAFDNCQENQSWQQVSDFLEEMNKVESRTLRFTFFLSAVGLIKDSAKAQYQDPTGQRGRSNIRFGGSEKDVLERIGHINKLYLRGNEIASHAVGHFDGGKWTRQMWQHEHSQYNRIIDRTAELNGFTGEAAQKARLAFGSRDLMGFRAPYLAGPKALIESLSSLNYRYDTSDTNQGYDPRTWPRRYNVNGKNGPWNFGLGFIQVPGVVDAQGRSIKIPAMDYNFCFRQDKGCPEKYPSTLNSIERDAQNMLVAYLNYFLGNYNGNRAPLHIGHHFQQYRGGHYNQSLMRFSRLVCTLPEVRCTTYSELTRYMDGLKPGERETLQSAKFPKASWAPTIREILDKETRR